MSRLFSLVTTLLLGGAAALSAGDKVFPPDAVIDVTRPPYSARPGDGQDDTAKIQQAISDHVGTGRTLYFPNGVYDLSAPLVCRDRQGRWRAHLTFQGQNRHATILKLADRTEPFSDPAVAAPVLVTGSHWEEGDAADGGGNKAFRNNIFDLTIDTGSGNPGAIGVSWAVSNQGAISNVTVRSGDGRGRGGIALLRRIPGPGLIKRVRVEGFQVGIDTADIQYGLTLEDIDLAGQAVAGVRTDRNLVFIHRLRSTNRVPALVIGDRMGCAVVIDARLTGGEPGTPAIDCAGTFLGRDLTTAGSVGLRIGGRTILPPFPPSVTHPGGEGKETPPVPIVEAPEYWNKDLSDWIAVGPRLPGESDDTGAIQRAMDAGKGTVYFPNTRVYFLSDTVVVRGRVRQILGMGSEISLGAARQPFSDRSAPRPLLRLDPTAHDRLFLENLFFNAQYPGEVLFENNTPATVVIRHCAGWVGADGHRKSYRNTPQGTGDVFLEDVFLPGWEFRRQRVWARQFNPENYDGDGSSPQVANHGGQLWILGFKTEGPAPFLATTNGRTELLGAYNYLSAAQADPVPRQAVPYSVQDSTAALSFTAENFRETGYDVLVRRVAGSRVQDWTPDTLPPRNGNPADRSRAVSVLFLGAAEP